MNEWLEKLLGGMGDSVGQIGQQSPQLLMLALLGMAMDKMQSKDLGGNPYKNALTSIGSDKANMNTMLQNAQTGQTQNPQVAQMRQMLQQRATTNPLQPMTGQQIQSNPLTANAPQRFNPYGGGQNANQGVDPAMLQRMMQMVMGGGGQNPGVGTLQGMLNSRMATRPMVG